MASIEVKRFDRPDETRPFEGTVRRMSCKSAGGRSARGAFEPGWRWSQNVKPIAGTDTCQVAHLGYCVSGRMACTMDDGDDRDRPR